MSATVPMLSINLDHHTRQLLLKVALDTIRHGIANGEPPASITPDGDNPRLYEREATFVTLKKNSELRGCIGTLHAKRSLLEDVAFNAFAAAFRDPRFSALVRSELENLEISVSLLGPRQEMTVHSEADLIRQLNVGLDGLILEESSDVSATFLPSVWESRGFYFTPEAKGRIT